MLAVIQKPKEKFQQKENANKATKIEKYFNYDELVHYKIEFDSNKRKEIYSSRNNTFLDSMRYGVIYNSIPKSINDSSFVFKLEEFGYTKKVVKRVKFKEIDRIFTERKHEEVIAYACDHVFRDILIFKRKSKIIGIAKICFECGGNEIVGTKANSEEFGMDGEYAELRQILNAK